MDKKYSWEKAENCFANARSYAYHMEEPVEEALLRKMEGEGSLEIRKSFKKPFYFGTLDNGVRVKGVVWERTMKVGFHEESWMEEKEDFERRLDGWMKEEDHCLGETESVCPRCLKKISARLIQKADGIYMQKLCEEHGSFETLIWQQGPDYASWGSRKLPVHPEKPMTRAERGCPYDCGLCEEHRQLTCCVLMEVTSRCNLGCPICFASSETSDASPDVPMEQIADWYDAMLAAGGPYNIQLSGGEPTLREDLPEIIALGREKGFTFFQLNTNGLRLAADKAYGRRLKEAGLNCVFLQFDGVADEVYETIRGRRLLEQKKKAIAVCRELGIGVVLVPVIVPGVNEHQVGDILKFALENMPAVRGVHFQPVSYFGRYTVGEKRRYPISLLLQAIEEQTEGAMKMTDFTPGGAENAYCSFSGNFILLEDGSLKAWHKENSCGCGSEKEPQAPRLEASAKAREFVARRWSASTKPESEENIEKESCGCCSTSALDDFLNRVDSYSLAVSAMGFMDAGNLDLHRLKECYIHVVTGRDPVKLIPFCAYNLTSEDGHTLYRGQES